MPLDFAPTKSKDFFVGRDAQMADFVDVLQGAHQQRIIHIQGPGGIGKTRLLEEFRTYALKQPRFLVTSELVDFYRLENQATPRLLRELVRQLAPARFHTFMPRGEIVDTDILPEDNQLLVNEITDDFVEDYKALLKDGYHVLLLFDTHEVMQPDRLKQYLLEPVIGGIIEAERDLQDEALDQSTPHHYQSTIVIAGRTGIEFPPSLQPYVHTTALPPLTPPQVLSFFRQGGMTEEQISDAEIAQLYDRTGGRPMFVALSFDWLSNGVGTATELLSLKEPFGQKLVEWLVRLATDEQQAILYTALAWRRMEPELLAQLMGIEVGQAQELIDRLEKFSFTKYCPPSEGSRGAFQLHDEMRDLVNRYVWPMEGEQTRNDIMRQVIQWYETRINNDDLLHGKTLPRDDEERALAAEWLYYQCLLDLDQAFKHQEALFRQASHFLDLAFCDMLNQEMQRFAGDLNFAQQDELTFREALVAFRRERFNEAGELWHSLLRRQELPEKLRATTLMLLVEVDGYTGEYDEALEHARKGEELYLQLLEGATEAQRRELEPELGQLYNNWGYIYRVKNDPAQALKFYNLALERRPRPKNEARTLNNIAYAHFLAGREVKASTYAGRAMQMRRELKIPYELGLSYNTMAQFLEHAGQLRDAVKLYQKALLAFQYGGSERGRSLVLLNLGRLKRMTEEYQVALKYLQQACRVFERKKDTDYAVNALHELGSTYQQRGKDTDWVEAENYLQKSLQLSRDLARHEDEAENLEDLCQLHYALYKKALAADRPEEAQSESALACDYAQKVHDLAQREKLTYRLAKSERLLGDLEYADKQYHEAFKHYLDACRLMAQAPVEAKHTSAVVRQRYEQLVNHLQDQLHSMPASQDEQYARALLERFQTFSPQEQEALKLTKEFLDETIEMASTLASRRS